MKFIWELEDLKTSNVWGLMASRNDELVILGGCSMTSLRDGFHKSFENREKLVEFLNENQYIPVLAPINPSVIIKAAAKKQFNYGGGFESEIS